MQADTALALAAPGAPGSSAAAAALLDDPVAQAAFTVWEQSPEGPRIARSHLQLGGLFCAACAGIIEQALLREPGVAQASVNYSTRRALVAWDASATRLSTLVAAIVRAGYSAAPDAAAPSRALRQAEQRSALWRLFVAVFCMMQVMMYAAPLYLAAPGTLAPDLRRLLLWAAWLLSVPVVLFSAAPMFGDALRGLRQRRIGMDLPVALGVAVMFMVSSGATFDPGGVFGDATYFDSLTMFVSFLLAGRYLALKMRNRVAATLEGALSRLPAGVRRVDADGSVSVITLNALRVGDRVRVLAGEAFVADGRLLEGCTEADEALLTGESRPVAKAPGDEVVAGSLNLRGPVLQLAERLGQDTRYEAIVALLRSALTERPALLRTADRIAGPFLCSVLVLAAAAGAAWSLIDPARAVWVAVSVLIVTCPCALSLAAPSALLAAAGALARRGVLVRRLDALEALATLDTLCFDKTGTLTDGQVCVARVHPLPAAQRAGLDPAALLQMAAGLAASSTHPLSRALAAQAKPGDARVTWTGVSEQAGFGLQGEGADGQRYRLGARGWAAGIAPPAPPIDETAPERLRVYLAGPGGALAAFEFAEALRPDAQATVARLQQAGLAVMLLSGDATARVREVGEQLGVTTAQGDAKPADKLAAVAALQRHGHRVGMVGDGLNDAPVMARADASFAIGDASALTRANADFILMSGQLADITRARQTARHAMGVVRQNLAWAVTYNAVCVPLALFGWFPPWLAGLGMATSSLVVVLNALRIDRRPRREPLVTPEAP
jgi:Cu2+-exporting ATPase